MKCLKHLKQKPNKKPKYNCEACLYHYMILTINKPRFLKQSKVITSKKYKDKNNYYKD